MFFMLWFKRRPHITHLMAHRKSTTIKVKKLFLLAWTWRDGTFAFPLWFSNCCWCSGRRSQVRPVYQFSFWFCHKHSHSFHFSLSQNYVSIFRPLKNGDKIVNGKFSNITQGHICFVRAGTRHLKEDIEARINTPQTMNFYLP